MGEQKEAHYLIKIKKQQKILEQLTKKELTQQVAANQLNLSERQIRRKLKRYQYDGISGLISKKIGRRSNHKLPEYVRQKHVSIVRTNYEDFGPTFAHEKLVEHHDASFCIETLRQWMISDNLWTPHIRPKARQHPLRPRRACIGELVQIDGSLHPWFENRAKPCTLLVAIDDSTSQILGAYFAEVESAANYLELFCDYFQKHGIPLSLYTDKHAIFKVNAKGCEDHETQFKRMMKAVGVKLIHANSPQAKGRVERVFRTLQDRLVKELRLSGINTIQAANEFLVEYLPKHNRKFSIASASPNNQHKPLMLSVTELEKLLSFKYKRKVQRDYTISCHGQRFQLSTHNPLPQLRGASVDILKLRNNKVIIEFEGKEMHSIIKNKCPSPCIEANSKTLNNTIEQLIKNRIDPLELNIHQPWFQQKSFYFERASVT